MKRASKVKNAKGRVAPKEGFADAKDCYKQGDGVIAASSTLVCVVYGGAGREVAVLRQSDAGKRTGPPKTLIRTDSTVIDLAFCPTDESLLATGHDSGAVRVWRITDSGGAEVLAADLAAPEAQLLGHSKRVTCVRWNPAAAGVLASCAIDGKTLVWATASQAVLLEHKSGEPVFSLCWNWDSVTLVTTGANKQLTVLTRGGGEPSSFAGHQGIKASTVVHLVDDLYACAGFSAQRERQLAVASTTQGKFVQTIGLDSGTGVMTLMWDRNTRIVTLVSRGDATVRQFELGDDGRLSALETYADASCMFIGATMAPARSVNFAQCEVLRMWGVAAHVLPLSVTIPRKVVKYDPELYTVGAPSAQPACTQAEWSAGWTGEPVTETVGPRAEVIEKATAAAEAARGFRRWNEEVPLEPAEPVAAPVHDEAEVAKFDGATYKKVEVVRSSHYRHVFGTGTKPTDCLTGVTPSKSSTDSTLIAASATHMAVVLESANGKVLVVPVTRTGRLLPSTPDVTIETGSSVADIAFSRYQPSVYAVAQDSGIVSVWDGLTSAARIAGHRRKVTSLAWSALTGAVVASAALGANGDVRINDIEKAAAVHSIANEAVTSLAFNYDDSRLVCACRDSTVLLYDVRAKAGAAATTLTAHETGERSMSLATGMTAGTAHHLLSAGFGKGSQRQLMLHDMRQAGKPLSVLAMGVSNGAMTLHWDSDTGVAFVAGKGDSSVGLFEVSAAQGKVFELTAWRATGPQVGVCFLPKSVCDVREVEIARMLKLHADKVEPVKFCVPRQRKEYFQDDVLPPTRDYSRALCDGAAWLSGAAPAIPMQSLCPAGMTALSVAPPPDKVKKPTSAYFLAKAAEESGSKNNTDAVQDALFAKVKAKDDAPTSAAPPAATEVKDDEWDD